VNNKVFIAKVQSFFELALYLAEFFLEWEIFDTKVVEKIKTHILCSITPPLPKKGTPFMR